MKSSKLLISNIVDSVRTYARRFSTFSDRGGGGVFIVVEPKSWSASEYFGLSRGETLRSYFATIFPDGREIITIPEEDNAKVCTFGFAAMKTSDAFYAVDHAGILMSGVYPYKLDQAGLDYDCGYAHHLGCVIFRVMYGSKHFCDIFVTTSGGRPREDVLSSYAAKEAIEKAFNSPGYAILAPELMDVQMAIAYAEDNERAKAEEADLLARTWNYLEEHFQEMAAEKRPPVQIGKVNEEVDLMMDEVLEDHFQEMAAEEQPPVQIGKVNEGVDPTMDEVSRRSGRRRRTAVRNWLSRFDFLPKLARFWTKLTR